MKDYQGRSKLANRFRILKIVGIYGGEIREKRTIELRGRLITKNTAMDNIEWKFN